MLLMIDIGNTNIVLGCIKDNDIKFTSRFYTDKSLSDDQYTILIKNLLDIYNINKNFIEGCIISSVVPPLLDVIKNAVYKIIKKDILVVGPGVKTGLNILTDNPAQLGSDLVVNSVACIIEYNFDKPIIIIDMGTATTISILDKNKNYIGGNIMPGVKISLNALSSMTAQLPAISLDTPKDIFGSNTIDCMQSGIIYGTVCMIDGIIDKIESKLNQKATLVATGGISNHIIPLCNHNIIFDENLTLKGLNYIYKKNKNI